MERAMGTAFGINCYFSKFFFFDATKYKKFFFRIELLQGKAFTHRQSRLGAYTHKQELHVCKENYLSRRAVPDWAARKV